MSQRIIILGKRFADLRRERYLTQDEFAQKLDMSAANVRRLEQSESSGMQFRNFRKLATLVNVSPQELRRRICVPTTQESEAARGAGALQDEQFPRGIRPDTLREVTEVEHFHGVSAARTEQRT